MQEEYINILNCIVDTLNIHFKHTSTNIIKQDSNTFVVDIDTTYKDKTEDVYLLLDLVYAIEDIFNDYPMTDASAITGMDDIMHALYIYPSEDLGHQIFLHTRVYAELRFVAINPEMCIRIHIHIPQCGRNLKLIRDELYTKILHPKYYRNFIQEETLKQFKN